MEPAFWRVRAFGLTGQPTKPHVRKADDKDEVHGYIKRERHYTCKEANSFNSKLVGFHSVTTDTMQHENCIHPSLQSHSFNEEQWKEDSTAPSGFKTETQHHQLHQT